MTHTHKNLKIVCVKLIGKIGCMLVADIVYIIVQHLQSSCQTLDTHKKKEGKEKSDIKRMLEGDLSKCHVKKYLLHRFPITIHMKPK